MTAKLAALPEFYALVDEQRIVDEKSLLGDGLSLSIKSERQQMLKRQIAAQSKVVQSTPTDKFYDSFRKADRKLYSRGHVVHQPGARLAPRPSGSCPVVPIGHSTTDRTLMATSTVRPTTSSSRLETTMSADDRPMTGKSSYSRCTSPSMVMRGRIASPQFPGKKFEFPLSNIQYPAPSNIVSDISKAYLPDRVENILTDTRFLSIGGFSQRELFQKTPQMDRKYLADKRKVKRIISDVRPQCDPLYRIDYEPLGSPERVAKFVCKQRAFPEKALPN